jgi:hypothetical protein
VVPPHLYSLVFAGRNQ